MKNYLSAFLGFIFLFAACQKEELVQPQAAEEELVEFNVNVALDRGLSKVTGDGTQVNRCIMGIYRNGSLYGEKLYSEVTAGTGGAKSASFSVRLVNSATYDFVLWADKVTSTVGDAIKSDLNYDTSDLTAIKANSYKGNDEGFDAFTAVYKDYKVNGSFSLPVTLTRPFGQVVVSTTDMADIYADDSKPDYVKVSYSAIPTSFNALTGEPSTDTSPVEYTAAVISKVTGELTVDYLWAGATQSNLADFTITFFSGTDPAALTQITVNDSFTNVPIRRNYRSLVSGRLITSQGDVMVNIDPATGGSVQVADAQTAQTALALGYTEVTIAALPTGTTDLTIPDIPVDGSSISITFPKITSDQTINLLYTEDAVNYPSVIHLYGENDGGAVNYPKPSGHGVSIDYQIKGGSLTI